MTPYYRYAGTKNAKQIGLGVDACAARLLRFAYAESRLMFLQAAHIISTPSRDLKALLSRYQYEDAQHADRPPCWAGTMQRPGQRLSGQRYRITTASFAR